MNADNPVAPGAQGPYTYPVGGVPGQAQAGQSAPIEGTRPHASVGGYPGVQATSQQGVAPQQPYQHGVQPAPQQAQAGQAPPTVPATGVHPQHSGTSHTGTGVAATNTQVTSGTAPVRAPFRKGIGATGSSELNAEQKGGILGGLSRFVRRNRPEKDGGPEGSTQLKKKGGGPRRVRAMLTTVDPWSVMKLAFLLSIAAGIMFVVATAIVWNVLNQMGVFTSINDQITTILGPESKVTFLQFTDRNKIMSVVILLSVVNSVLMTGLATIGALLYNLIVKLVGGVYITLTDE